MQLTLITGRLDHKGVLIPVFAEAFIRDGRLADAALEEGRARAFR